MTALLHPKINQLNDLFEEIQADKAAHPETKIGYNAASIGSILNAYREGDVSFDDAVALLDAKGARAILARKLVEAVEGERLGEILDRSDQVYMNAIYDALAAMARVLAEENIELGLVEELRKEN